MFGDKGEKNMGSMKRYMEFVRPYRFQIIATLFIGVIKFAIPLLIPLLSKYLIDDVIVNDTLQNRKNLLIWELQWALWR